MRSSSNRLVERAQPWLGTTVKIQVPGLQSGRAHRAIDAAFAEVAQVHRLMSFHDPDSDVSLLNRHAAGPRPVRVHRWTLAVLAQAQAISEATAGCFDISAGAELVASGLLPRPVGAPEPAGTWRDIEILADCRVSFRRPLWIDLGGIAKGYAVDRALARLRELGAHRAVVNAGGDIGVGGGRVIPIALEAGIHGSRVPVLELAEGSVAGSGGCRAQPGSHIDGIHRTAVPPGRFVCVVARRCVIADALTKVVMAQGACAAGHLQRFSAVAHVCEAEKGWLSFGAGSVPA
jgi:thiamine biosynthesis lipoprotein